MRLIDKAVFSYFISELKKFLNSKVDVELDKGLSTNDYTNTDKDEVAKIGDKADMDYVTSKVRTDVPAKAKFDGVVSSEEEPSNLVAGDEWHKEKAL